MGKLEIQPFFSFINKKTAAVGNYTSVSNNINVLKQGNVGPKDLCASCITILFVNVRSSLADITGNNKLITQPSNRDLWF